MGLFLSCFLLGILVCLILGYLLGRRMQTEETQGVRPLKPAIFGLMGLLIAFTFSGAMFRYDVRRDSIIAEVDAIRSAYFLLDVLEPRYQEPLREFFHQYVALRVETYRNRSSAELQKYVSQTHSEQRQLWNQVIPITHGDAERFEKIFIVRILLPALNQMFSLTNTRMASATYHEPLAVYLLLIMIVFISAFILGHDLQSNQIKNNIVYLLGFFIIFTATLYVIVDMEFPRLGIIHLKYYDKPLIELGNQI